MTDARCRGEAGWCKYLIWRYVSPSPWVSVRAGNGTCLQFALDNSKPMKTRTFPEFHFATREQIEMLIGPRQPIFRILPAVCARSSKARYPESLQLLPCCHRRHPGLREYNPAPSP